MDYQEVNGEIREVEPPQRDPVVTFELTCGCETQSMNPEDHKTGCRLRTMLVMSKKPEAAINKVIVSHRPVADFMLAFASPEEQKAKGWIRPPTASISIPLTLFDEGYQAVTQMFRSLPTLCPQCAFKHPSNMFHLTDAGQACVRCGYVLREGDYWPDEVH